MITFKAQYIQPTTIKRRGLDGNFHDYKASIVELNADSENDLLALNKANCEWGNCKTILCDITRIFNFLNNKTRESQAERFFALTKQKENFEKLNEKDLLGVLQTRRNKDQTLEIENFQVAPDTNYNAVVRNYKNIGKSLIECIKEVFKNEKEILLEAEKSSIPFYEKQGFIKTGVKNTMIFKR